MSRSQHQQMRDESADVRHWKAWALLEPDGPIHRIYLSDPSGSASVRGLIELGWKVIQVRVEEA